MVRTGKTRTKPVLSLCMIVRNEADVLERCLRSVEPVVDEMVIIDTGSTDGTVGIAKQYGARVKQVDWQDDFARARNIGIELARGEWVLILDADEELNLAGEDVLRLRGLLERVDCEAYICNIMSELEDGQQVRHESVRLWRNRAAYRFEGAVHEQILPGILRVNPAARVDHAGLTILHHGYSDSLRDQKVKASRNLIILERTVRDSGGDLFSRYNLGVSHLQVGDADQACAVFDAVFQEIKGTEPWAPSLVRAYALALEQRGDLDRALEVLEQGLDLWGDYTELLYIQGLVFKRKGLYSKALAVWRQCVSRGEPPSRYVATEGVGSYLAYEQLGLLYLRLKEYDKAIASFTAALRSKADFSRPFYHLAHTLKECGYHQEQVADYLETHFYFANPQSRILFADVLLQSGAYEQSLKQLDRALLQVSVTDAIRLMRGRILLRLRRIEQALDEFEAISVDGPEFPQALWYACYCCWLMEPPVRAEAALRRLRESGREGEAAVLGGYQRLLCGGEASDEYSGLPDAVKVECGLRLVEGLLEAAAPAQADIAAEMIGGHVGEDAPLRLGKLFYRFREVERAINWFLNGLKEGNYDVEALRVLGEVCCQRDLLEDAEQLFAEALSLDPHNLETHLTMARVYLEQAKRTLERGRNFVPGSLLLQEEMKRIEESLKWL